MSQAPTNMRKFFRNPLGLAGSVFIVLVFIFGVFAVLFSPDKSTYANEMHLPIASKEPLFSIVELSIQEAEPEGNIFTGYSYNSKKRLINKWEWLDSGVLIWNYVDEGIMGESEFLPVSSFPDVQDAASFAEKHIHKRVFILGTDRFGRDMLSRMLWGARVSLAVGAVAVFISLFIGILLGALAGYFGGWVDRSIMWLINVVWSLPTLLLVIALSLALGKGFWQIFIAVGLSMWVEVARMVRGQVLSIKQKEYVESARVLGFSHGRILFRHILPNITGPITVIAAANFAAAILLEAGLSFLGLGVQPPMPSWGQMIKEHFGYIILDSAYLAIIPGLAIMLLVMSFNFVGNALRDTLDVRMK